MSSSESCSIFADSRHDCWVVCVEVRGCEVVRLRGGEQVGGEAAGVGGAGAAVVDLAGERVVAGGQLVDLLLQRGDRRVVLRGPRVRVVAGRAITV